MKRIVLFSALIGLTAAPLLMNAAPAKADGLFGLFNRGGSSSYNYGNRGPRARAPQVRGFRFGGGTTSMTLGDSYSFDPNPKAPDDFGPYLDNGANPYGIIPASPHP